MREHVLQQRGRAHVGQQQRAVRARRQRVAVARQEAQRLRPRRRRRQRAEAALARSVYEDIRGYVDLFVIYLNITKKNNTLFKKN